MWREEFFSGKSPLRFFLFSSRPHWKAAVFALGFALVADVLSTSVSYVFKLIANAAAALPQESAYAELLLACGAYILLLAFAKAFWRISGFFGSSWAMGAMATARHNLTAYVTLHSRAYFSNRFAGSLANKISHAARGMREFVDQILWEFLEVGVTAIASLIILFSANAQIAFIFLLWVVVVLVVNIALVRKRVPLTEYSHRLETGLNGATVDLMTNISAMQEYARRPFELRRLQNAVDKRRVAGLKSWRFGEWIRVVNSLILVIFGGAMTFTVVWFARSGIVSLGDIILVLTIIFRVEGMLQGLGSNLNKVSETWGEIQESLDEIIEPHEIADRAGAGVLTVPRGEIIFDRVTFRYSEMRVFKDLSLVIPSGQRVGLVGRSGAGKSTLMRVLLHHHDVQVGKVMIDGQDIAGVTQESLRRAIAVVPQEPLLFHRSIRENIAYGRPDASFEEIVEAAKKAQAREFIGRVPEGYDALVGERGIKLSGGERQRIAIARAILKNAPILLLDEATSSLDSESEVAIQKALHELMHGKTVIAIAHRLSTLREMDRILVMDEGAIVEDGTHAELLERKGVYAALWEHQAGGFILDE